MAEFTFEVFPEISGHSEISGFLEAALVIIGLDKSVLSD